MKPNTIFSVARCLFFILTTAVSFPCDGRADQRQACPPLARNTIPLLQQNQNDYSSIAGKVSQLNGNKKEILLLLCDYTDEVFSKYGYSLAETIDSCVKGQFDPQFNYNYIKSGLQKLIEPVLFAALDATTSSEVIKRGYVYQKTLDFISEAQSKQKP